MDKVRAHVFVSGLVQGVFFRANTVETAESIGGLTGWVRNTPDGRVEVVAEGPRDRAEKLLRWLHKGPPAARVSGVDVEWEKPAGEFSSFGVRY
ncbi:MAG: acylphosphatase [Candidatus Nitrospinota bacterium M3_3B_026]